MAFTITLTFDTEQQKTDFLDKCLPRVRGQQADPAAPAEDAADQRPRAGVAVTSASAARDLCHQLVAFLAHSKVGRVTLSWHGADGQEQAGDILAGSAREAETTAVRVAAAARAGLKS